MSFCGISLGLVGNLAVELSPGDLGCSVVVGVAGGDCVFESLFWLQETEKTIVATKIRIVIGLTGFIEFLRLG